MIKKNWKQVKLKEDAHCLSIVGRGISHNFTHFTFRENMRQLAIKDSKVSELIATAIVAAKDYSPHGTIRLSHAGGSHPIPLTKGNLSIF